jgi:predicted transcriptional regulator
MHISASYSVRREKMATLNDLITEAGLRKKELSDQSGVDVATIIRIGNGKATTRVTVVKLVRILEKNLNRSIDIDSIEGLNITR